MKAGADSTVAYDVHESAIRRSVVVRWRTVRRVAATVFVGLAVPGAVGAVGIAGATGEIYTARDGSAPPALVDMAAAPSHDPDKPTAVVVLGSEGANAADVLAPYEVLAGTGRSTSTPPPRSASRCR
jgi:hypothetical protein